MLIEIELLLGLPKIELKVRPAAKLLKFPTRPNKKVAIVPFTKVLLEIFVSMVEK